MGKLTVGELEPGTVFVHDGMVYVHNGGTLDDGRTEVMIIGPVAERDAFCFTTLASDAVVAMALSLAPEPVTE